MNIAFREAAPTVTSLVVGDSRDQFGFRPKLIHKDMYNWGLASSGLYESLSILKLAIPQSPQLKDVYITTSFYRLGHNLSKTSESWRCLILQSILNIPYEVENIPAAQKEEIFALAQKEKKHRHHIKLEQGFDYPGKTIAHISKEFLQKRVQTHIKIYKRNDFSKQHLLEMIELCKKHKITLHLVKPPLRSDYQAELSKQLDGSIPSSDCELAAQYGIEIIDLSHDYSNEHFCDCDHLSTAGANLFSQRFSNNIENNRS